MWAKLSDWFQKNGVFISGEVVAALAHFGVGVEESDVAAVLAGALAVVRVAQSVVRRIEKGRGAPGVAALLVLAVAAGCASVPERARDVYGGYVVTREIAAEIVEQPEVPDDVVAAIARADEVAAPAADALRIALVAYHTARAEGADEDTLDRLLQGVEVALDETRAAIDAYEAAALGGER